MKLGIISDIHGNIFAFKEIYKQLMAEECHMHLFLGDVCGYYYHQAQVIDLLQTLPRLESIAGNHDRMFLRSMANDRLMKEYTERFGLSFANLKETVTPHHLKFIQDLPREFHMETEHRIIAGFHGSPWNPIEEYVYPDSPIERFNGIPYHIVFLGHTHRPMDRTIGNTRIINPGSAGQPRDGGWPSYGVFHLETGQLEIKRVPYDVQALENEILSRDDDNAYLVDVIYRIQGEAES